jgi:voltage-gated potassium channel
MRIKARIWEIIEVAKPGDIASRVFDIFILAIIFLNVLAIILETVNSLQVKFSHLFYYFEIFSVAIFTIEYCLRVWSCTSDPKYRNPLTGRLSFIKTPLAIIDLLAILPFYIGILFPAFGLDLRFIRVVRLMRLFRIAKLGRYSSAFTHICNVIRKKREELVVTFTLLLLLLILSSCLMYYIENPIQPQVFSSIPETIWWAVVTLTTVGYGDIYPISPLGRILAAVVAILGIGLFALPAGLIASGFIEEVQNKGCPRNCPHCGKEI